MSDEISLNKGWTLDGYIAHNESMRDELDRRYLQRFLAQEQAVAAALTSAKEAVIKAETASEKRFESVNEFRATLADQATSLISRSEVETQFKAIDDKVDIIMGRMDRLEGRAGGSTAAWAYAFAAAGLIGTLVGIIGGVAAIVVLFSRGG